MNQYHINLAKRKARQGNVKRGKISALAFSKSGELIASAHNRRITANPDKRIWTEHAEIALLNKLKRLKAFSRYGGITVLVLRVTPSGLNIAKPCKKCQSQLDKYDLNVLYTNRDGMILPLKSGGKYGIQ